MPQSWDENGNPVQSVTQSWDENGNPVDFQGCDYTMVLLFEHVSVTSNYDNTGTDGGTDDNSAINSSSLQTQTFNNFKRRAMRLY